MIKGYKDIVKKHARRTFSGNPMEQLFLSVCAVFDSWDNQRAIVYRQLQKIPGHLGLAVNIQSIVFGNMGNDSGTGVAFTRCCPRKLVDLSLTVSVHMNHQFDDAAGGYADHTFGISS